MRWFASLVLALGVMGCSDTAGSSGLVFPCTQQGIVDAIAEGGGPHTFDCDGPQTVVTAEAIVIDNHVTLDGAGTLTVEGSREHRVFSVAAGVAAGLRGFTVTNGNGGIENRGSLTLTNSTVSGNHTLDDGDGGGIHNRGTMTLVGTTVSGNTAEGWGGGIYNYDGTLVLTNSTVSGNQVIANPEEPWKWDATLVNAQGLMTLVASTVSGIVYSVGRGFGGDAVTVVTFAATLIRGRCVETDPEIAPTEWVSYGRNIVSPRNSCGFDQPTDQVEVTAEQLALGPLQDNGGPTQTHALGEGSVAIDQMPAEDCVDADGEPLTTDQRGEPRGSMCDVGAFEVQP